MRDFFGAANHCSLLLSITSVLLEDAKGGLSDTFSHHPLDLKWKHLPPRLQNNPQKGQHHLLYYMNFTVISAFIINSGLPSIGQK